MAEAEFKYAPRYVKQERAKEYAESHRTYMNSSTKLKHEVTHHPKDETSGSYRVGKMAGESSYYPPASRARDT
jgi:hypothetical protein